MLLKSKVLRALRGSGAVLSVVLVLWLATAVVAAEQVARNDFRAAFVVETDAAGEKQLATAREYAAQGRWEAAIALLRDAGLQHPAAVVQVEPTRALALSGYANVLLSRLPPEGLATYRRGVDAWANARFATAQADGDVRALREIVQRTPLASAGDDAVALLAEWAWERGDIPQARDYWTRLVPLGATAAGAEVSAVFRYPDSDVDLAGVRSRLILCSLAAGERDRAVQELAAFRLLHPAATGHLAGRDGLLADILQEVLTPDSAAAARSENDWTPLSSVAAVQTFAAGASRTGQVSSGRDDAPATMVPHWFQPLPLSPYLTDIGRPALPQRGPRCYYPVIWQQKVFLADSSRIFGFETATGQAAWTSKASSTGVIYPPAAEGDAVNAAAGLPLLGTPRHTLTLHGNQLLARIGPPATVWPRTDLRRPETSLICLDLAREGLLQWSLGSRLLGPPDEYWAWEGPPSGAQAGESERVYVLGSRSHPQPQLNALCLDLATGTVIWNRPVGAALRASPEGAAVMTHRLVAVSGERIYIATEQGAIVCLDAADGLPVWVAWYDSHVQTPGPAANDPDRTRPACCLVDGGVVVAAPGDSSLIFAYDAATGVELWRQAVRGGGHQLLGCADGILAVAGRQLHGLDLHTGQLLWTVGYEDAAGFGAGQGLILGSTVLWPTRETLLAVQVETGRITMRLPLKAAYELSGGGNLAATADWLLLARPDGLVSFRIGDN